MFVNNMQVWSSTQKHIVDLGRTLSSTYLVLVGSAIFSIYYKTPSNKPLSIMSLF